MHFNVLSYCFFVKPIVFMWLYNKIICICICICITYWQLPFLSLSLTNMSNTLSIQLHRHYLPGIILEIEP